VVVKRVVDDALSRVKNFVANLDDILVEQVVLG
jgi:hypothetical protein